MALTTTSTRLRLHLRRALSLSSSLLQQPTTTTITTTTTTTPSPLPSFLNQPLFFSPPRLSSPRLLSYSNSRSSFRDLDKIDPDTILFEGCDYKHWLIVMDFGKDPEKRPPPEEMVETYVQTLAKVVGR